MSEIKDAREAKGRIIKKALSDSAFKKALLANANGAIEGELGVKLPAGLKVKVLEDSASQIHLVLPAFSPVKKEGLSESELSRVSGGFKDGSTKPYDCMMNTEFVCK